MEKYVWIALLGIEIVYVGATLSGELLAMLLSHRMVQFERRLHALPDERYYGAFATPVISFMVGLLGGVSTSLIGEGPESTFAGVLFTALIVFALMQHQFREATGRHPRPVARARWRQQAADMHRVLAATRVPTGRERIALRSTARRLLAVGTRLTEAALTQTWRDAYWQESVWKRARIITSVALPVILGVWPAVTHGISLHTLVGYAVLLVLMAGAAGAPALRRLRFRREILGLGRELVEDGRRLLDQLAAGTVPARRRPLTIRSTAMRQRVARRRV